MFRKFAFVFVWVFSLFALSCAQTTLKQSNNDDIVIMIGIDGLRSDFIDKYPAPELNKIANNGVRAEYMTAVMPSLTFVNFYSLATGLYAENTGITSNMPYSRKFSEAMDRTMHGQSRWWGGEPIWVSAEKQGVKTAAMFWLGSEAEIKGLRPSIWNKYDHFKPNKDRVKEVLSWLDLPKSERPRFITLYFSDVDSAAHRYGPNSVEVANAIKEVDNRIADLRKGISSLGLDERVNLVIVSDHGMSETSKDRMIYLDDYIDFDEVFIPRFEGKAGASLGAFVNIYLEKNNLDEIYNKLKDKNPHMRVYKFKDIPKKWYLDNYDRMGDIFIVADAGWLIWGKGLKSRYKNPPKGMHGFDVFHPEMRASFLAIGPGFKKSFKARPIESVDVYSINAHLLGIKPAKTDGDFERVKEIFTQP